MEEKKRTGYPEDSETEFLEKVNNSFFRKLDVSNNHVKYAYITLSPMHLIIIDDIEKNIFTEYRFHTRPESDESLSDNKIICELLGEIWFSLFLNIKYENSQKLWEKCRENYVPDKANEIICNILNNTKI